MCGRYVLFSQIQDLLPVVRRRLGVDDVRVVAAEPQAAPAEGAAAGPTDAVSAASPDTSSDAPTHGSAARPTAELRAVPSASGTRGPGGGAPTQENAVRPSPLEQLWRPSYNIAPTHTVPILRMFRGTPTLGPAGWGYPPKTVFNARGETAFSKPTFRGSERCIFLMDGWYEWVASEADSQGSGRPRKQPYVTFREDREPLLVAGLCRVNDGELHATIVTTAASEDMAWLHHRMPRVLLAAGALTGAGARQTGMEDEAVRWLSGTPEQAQEMAAAPGVQHFRELPDGQALRSVEADPAVGRVGNNYPELITAAQK